MSLTKQKQDKPSKSTIATKEGQEATLEEGNEGGKAEQPSGAGQPTTSKQGEARRRGNGAASRSKARKVNSNTKIKTAQSGNKHDDKKENALDDVEMYRDTDEKKA
jgi:hypothetical protein